MGKPRTYAVAIPKPVRDALRLGRKLRKRLGVTSPKGKLSIAEAKLLEARFSGLFRVAASSRTPGWWKEVGIRTNGEVQDLGVHSDPEAVSRVKYVAEMLLKREQPYGAQAFVDCYAAIDWFQLGFQGFTEDEAVYRRSVCIYLNRPPLA